MSTSKSILLSFVTAIVSAALALAVYIDVAPPKNQVINRTVVVNKGSSTKGAKFLSPEEIYSKLSPGIVNIRASQNATSDPFGGTQQQQSSTGSGFIISKSGLIITNEHVVENSDVTRVTLADQTELEARVLGTDTNTDIALLKIEPGLRNLTVLDTADSDELQVGDTVYAIGNPLGLDRSMSQGIISALNRSIDAPSGFSIRNIIQTDAAINRGNSGGALIDAAGKVVGVTAQIATSGSSGNIGIAFAIPSNTVRKIASQLEKTGKAEHAWLGMSGQPVTKALAKELKLPVSEGALVARVIQNSPAEKAGMQGSTFSTSGSVSRVGDIVVSMAGKKVVSMENLVTIVDSRDPGDKVKMVVYRNNKKVTLSVELGARPTKISN